MRAVLAPMGWAVIVTAVCPGARGEVQVEKVVGMPDFGAEELHVVNRLGAVKIVGWDRPEVQVRAVKRANRAKLAELLRVQVSRRSGRRLVVGTFVRVRPALGRSTQQRLHALLERQDRLLRAMVWGRSSGDALEQLRSIDRDFDRLRQRRPLGVVQPVELSLPVEQGSVDLTISVPRHLAVRARTLADDLTMRGCRAGAALSSQSGAITVHDSRGAIRAFAPRGTQRFTRISGDLTVEGGSGDVILRQVDGGVLARSVGGAIDAAGLRVVTAELRTIGGAIRLSAPLAARAHYRLVSLDGDLIVRLPAKASAMLEGRAPRWDFGRFRPRELIRRHQRVEAKLGEAGLDKGAERRLQLTTGLGQVKLVALGTEADDSR